MVNKLPSPLSHASHDSTARKSIENPYTRAKSPAKSGTSSRGSGKRRVAIALRKGAEWVALQRRRVELGAAMPTPRNTLRFGDPANVYEAIFPEGAKPPKGSEEEARMKAVFEALVPEAEAIVTAEKFYIGVHGAWVEPGPIKLRDSSAADIAEVVERLRALESEDKIEEPAERPVPAADAPKTTTKVAPSMPTRLPPTRPSPIRAAEAALSRAASLLETMRALREDLVTLRRRSNGNELALSLNDRRLMSALKTRLRDAADDARSALNAAQEQIKSHEDTPAGRGIVRRAQLLRASVMVGEAGAAALTPDKAHAAARLVLNVLDRDPDNLDAYNVLAHVHRNSHNKEAAYQVHLEALKAFQRSKHPGDPPVQFDAPPFYDDAPPACYEGLLKTLPSDAPQTLREQLTQHLTVLKELARYTKDPQVANGADFSGPRGGSVKSPRDDKKGATQYYTVTLPEGVTVGRTALSDAVLSLHTQTSARGFLNPAGEPIEQQCGFNRLWARREGILLEDFDGAQRFVPAEGGSVAVRVLCQSLPEGALLTVEPRAQLVRCEGAELYVNYRYHWYSDLCAIQRGDVQYHLHVGAGEVPNDDGTGSASRLLRHATGAILGEADDLCRKLNLVSIVSQTFARLVVHGDTVEVTPHFDAVPVTREVRHETRHWIEKCSLMGMDEKEVTHLMKQIRDVTTITPIKLSPGDDMPPKVRAAYNGIITAYRRVAGFLPDGRLEITNRESPIPEPKLYHRSGHRLWYPSDVFSLINQELYLRALGKMGTWGDHLEAKLLRDMGLPVCIWRDVGQKYGFFGSYQLMLPEGHEAVQELMDPAKGRVLNIMHKGEVHYVTLLDVEVDPNDPRRATSSHSLDNPGGGDCFYYAVLNAARRLCPGRLPQSVRDVMGMHKEATAEAVQALRRALQQHLMEKLDSDPEEVARMLFESLSFDPRADHVITRRSFRPFSKSAKKGPPSWNKTPPPSPPKSSWLEGFVGMGGYPSIL